MGGPLEREALRTKLVARIPGWYSPHLHLLVPSLFGASVMAIAIVTLDQLRWIELLTIPVVYILSNAAEWRLHRHVLHKRRWFAPILYDRHTPQHHALYVTDDMAVRSAREWRLVLIPAYGIVLTFLATIPITLTLWRNVSPNVAALFAATTMGYVILYEWLHLAFHQPPDSVVGRLPLIPTLRRHHAIHHSPENMQKYNFNVTVPLWDLVRRTMAPA